MLTHDLEVIKNGKAYRVSNNFFTDRNVQVIDFDVDTAQTEYAYDSNDRLNGRFFVGSKQEARKAVLRLSYNVNKLSQTVHLKNNLAKLFSGVCTFRELRALDIEIKFEKLGQQKNQEFQLDYITGKQIDLVLASPISFNTSETTGTIEIEFETYERPHYESIGRSLDLETGTKLNLWSSDMEIDWNKDSAKRKYTFTNIKQGDVFYHGDVPINQFTQDCTVTITLASDTKNFSWYTEFGEEMVVKDIELKAGDVLKYDGIQVFKNNLSINEYTRGAAQPVFFYGFNQFRFNSEVQKVIFDMKFYYE